MDSGGRATHRGRSLLLDIAGAVSRSIMSRSYYRGAQCRGAVTGACNALSNDGEEVENEH